MYHLCLHAAPGTVLFRTFEEARALWDRIVERVRLRALALMPTHVHAGLRDAAELAGVNAAARGYALWRNRRRGETGPVWRAAKPPRLVEGDDHVQRTQRYIHLNPCREGLVADPLAWPFATHRDACGLALPPVCRRAADPAAFHAYVSSDPSVRPLGTLLPEPRPGSRGARGSPDEACATLDEVFAAVSALTRTPAAAMRRRGYARDCFIRAARALTDATSAEIAARAGVDASTVRHAAAATGRDPALRVIERVLGDARFAELHDRDLRREHGWREYRNLR